MASCQFSKAALIAEISHITQIEKFHFHISLNGFEEDPFKYPNCKAFGRNTKKHIRQYFENKPISVTRSSGWLEKNQIDFGHSLSKRKAREKSNSG